MRLPAALLRGCFGLLVGSLSGCADVNKQPLAGRYYTTATEDGEPGLYFDDPQLEPTYLKEAMSTGVTKSYVVTRWDSWYLFPLAAATAEAARRGRIGPLTEASCKQRIYQLTGDSLHLTRFAL
jgi:hypothetical protein